MHPIWLSLKKLNHYFQQHNSHIFLQLNQKLPDLIVKEQLPGTEPVKERKLYARIDRRQY